jgi:hypothetical protein
MRNPWLMVPLSDYEGHMTSPEVAQLGVLAELFAEALRLRQPASVAVLGVAGGNGLERIDNKQTRRVVGIDVNPVYLDAVRSRYQHLTGLELHCCDLGEDLLQMPPVELVHAALVFEHAGIGRCLENALVLVSKNGALSVVLQLPGDPGQDVGKGGYPSIRRHIASHFVLIEPDWMVLELEKRGFRKIYQQKRFLPAGKAFWMGVFAREN